MAHAAAPPLEFGLLGVAARPWTVEDALRLAHLAAADINLLVWLRLLRQPRGPDWPETWRRLVGAEAKTPEDPAAQLLLGIARSGSNALAVAGRRSATGAAWLGGQHKVPRIINDPDLFRDLRDFAAPAGAGGPAA